jgi:rfaE bifunctional protein nucleotidyltransferase chain/domain
MADVILVSDYGAGTTAHAPLRELLAAMAGRRLVCWDPHPRGTDPVGGCALVTPNLAEARATVGDARALAEQLARVLVRQWEARAVAVTAGEVGAWLATSADEPYFVAAPLVPALDTCGAGDRFAATAAQSLARGAVPSEAVASAVAEASAWVARGGAAAFWADKHPTVPAREKLGSDGAFDLVARVRQRGGTIVATGGCFDVLHAGHVSSLEAAARLGDALVVLLNSDRSVRRLKGPDRPAQPSEDRARLLLALSTVDAVVVFEEDDPCTVLDRLRPEVWVKGGDYDATALPELDLVRSWGGRVVLLPYLAGRSTSAILKTTTTRGAPS